MLDNIKLAAILGFIGGIMMIWIQTYNRTGGDFWDDMDPDI